MFQTYIERLLAGFEMKILINESLRKRAGCDTQIHKSCQMNPARTCSVFTGWWTRNFPASICNIHRSMPDTVATGQSVNLASAYASELKVSPICIVKLQTSCAFTHQKNAYCSVMWRRQNSDMLWEGCCDCEVAVQKDGYSCCKCKRCWVTAVFVCIKWNMFP